MRKGEKHVLLFAAVVLEDYSIKDRPWTGVRNELRVIERRGEERRGEKRDEFDSYSDDHHLISCCDDDE